MRIAVAGGGNVGLFIANDLRGGGHEVLILERDPFVVGGAQVEPGVEWRLCDACEPQALQDAGLDKCEVLIAATGDDEDNLVISLLAKQEFGVPRVIARINHPKNEWLFNESWGVDLSVSTPHLITALVEEALSVGQLVRLLNFEGGQAQLVEITLAQDAPAIGKEIKALGIPRDATVVAVIRHKHVVMPHGDTTFEAGDEVLALVTPDSQQELKALFVS